MAELLSTERKVIRFAQSHTGTKFSLGTSPTAIFGPGVGG
jgi:hypothetical protein